MLRLRQESFITLCIQTSVFIVILTTFRPMRPSAFFRCFMSNSETLTELQTLFLIHGGSNSVNYDLVKVLSYSKCLCYLPVVGGCPRGVMVKAMNCGIVVRDFVLQSRYYVHFRANTLGKGMNPLILPPAMGK